jgi:hypothetical protein
MGVRQKDRKSTALTTNIIFVLCSWKLNQEGRRIKKVTNMALSLKE